MRHVVGRWCSSTMKRKKGRDMRFIVPELEVQSTIKRAEL